MSKPGNRDVLVWAMSLVAIAFGVLTIKEGGAVLFVDGAARVAAGHYVPFVLWFNFIAGFAYLIAGAGLWLQRRWAVLLACVIAIATLGVFVAFAVHVAAGGAHEQRTVIAMTLRTTIWIAIVALSVWRLRQQRVSARESDRKHLRSRR